MGFFVSKGGSGVKPLYESVIVVWQAPTIRQKGRWGFIMEHDAAKLLVQFADEKQHERKVWVDSVWIRRRKMFGEKEGVHEIGIAFKLTPLDAVSVVDLASCLGIGDGYVH